MKASIAIKSILASIVFSLGVVSLRLRKRTKTGFLILMYHRVVSKNEAKKGVQAGMYVDPETFELHIRFLRKYFRIAPISEMFINSGSSFDNSNKKSVCFLTFDDGWLDFYEYAYPILKKLEIPATVFLPTNFIGTERWFWTDRLAHLLIKKRNTNNSITRKQASDNNLVDKLESLRGHFEFQLEEAISMLKEYRVNEIEEILSDLAVRWYLDSTIAGRAFLTWEEVSEMARSGLISYGSHTASHQILTTLTDEEIQNELMISKEKLIAEKVVDPSFIPFCYPNGNYNEKIAKMVKKAGYSLAVTTNNGWNYQPFDPFTLRRIAIHQDMTSTEAMFGCRVAGIF